MSAVDALLLVLALASARVAPDRYTGTFDAPVAGEAVATIRAACDRCDWAARGKEAAALRISIDGRYSQHLLIARGAQPSVYRMTLGAVAAGAHTLLIERDRHLSAPHAGPATIGVDDVTVLAAVNGDDALAQSMAPFLYARRNTVGRFTDLPILMWYEIVPTPRGRQFRYSVIFTNEDGGTATDRLMATWGRTTDIEFVYGAEVDPAGRILAEEFQGPGHEMPAFNGRHEGAHPLLWISTDNNMVSESGSTAIRYAPAPEWFDLANRSREAVMDRHPWSYALTAMEMKREGKIDDDALPGSGKIPDLRRYVFVEACGEVGTSALAFAVGVPNHLSGGAGELEWHSSDRGVPQFRIARDGCFRLAIPLPAAAEAREVRAIRVVAFERVADKGEPPRPTPVRLTRINTMFGLDAQYAPGPSMFHWEGTATIAAGGPPLDLPIR